MIFALLAVCLACLAAGLVLLAKMRAARRQARLPDGEIVYVDTGGWQRNEQPLFSDRLHLSGRPDYLVRQGSQVVPVEVKSTTGLKHPREHHVLQLMVYCLLVEQTEHVPPAFGLLLYPDVTFRIHFSPAARGRVIRQLSRLRRDAGAHDVRRSHADPRRCRHCGFRDACSQSL